MTGKRLLTGGEMIAEYLISQRVPYIVGIPGHGITATIDAFVDRKDKITVLQAIHEQGAAHLADGYYRASGQPLGVFTSIGPGAANTIMGIAQAYIDSTAMLVLHGSAHTYMRGRAVLQEIERTHWMNNARMLEPVVKRWWNLSSTAEVPYVLHRAFNTMMSGRRGPVLLDLPMDVQANQAEVTMPQPRERDAHAPVHAHRPDIERAAELLASAKRPVIVAGGGVISAEASAALLKLAEIIGAPVVTTANGKGAIPEDHELNAWAFGDLGSISGNTMTRTADVLLAVGCRFTDRAASSFRRGATFNIPPTKLIHLDIDPHEIGKNYPVEIGLVGDALATVNDLKQCLDDRLKKGVDWKNGEHFKNLVQLKAQWERKLSEMRDADVKPMTISRALKEARAVLARDAIVVTGAGNPQSQVYQEFPVYGPRQHITSGGYSTMGFTIPGAIGAKLAHPTRQVIGIDGDGSFLQTVQELAMACQYDIPIVVLVLNNFGWQSIKNLQTRSHGKNRVLATPFEKKDGTPYSAHLSDMAKSFGCYSERIEDAAEVGPALKRALKSGRPAVIEALTNRELPYAGLTATGWWDVPIPAYLKKERAEYDAAMKEEELN